MRPQRYENHAQRQSGKWKKEIPTKTQKLLKAKSQTFNIMMAISKVIGYYNTAVQTQQVAPECIKA